MGQADDPLKHSKELSDEDSEYFRNAMDLDLLIINSIKNREASFLPIGNKAINSKYFFNRKLNSAGNFTR